LDGGEIDDALRLLFLLLMAAFFFLVLALFFLALPAFVLGLLAAMLLLPVLATTLFLLVGDVPPLLACALLPAAAPG
jgi:hypothetical protein